ncbi:MAG: GntR family transcriptional regulator [Acholeplasmatales bacterium]|nr:GntR family transcriptional regulator [Acholeplasmatales bacterium]
MPDLLESLPIYIRIVKGIKDAILNGDLKEEEQLLSTTYLSKTYNINIATVNKAINILVDEGLVYKKRGIGMFVKAGALNQLREERKNLFKNKYVKAFLDEAKRLDISPEELQKIVKEAIEEMNK